MKKLLVLWLLASSFLAQAQFYVPTSILFGDDANKQTVTQAQIDRWNANSGGGGVSTFDQLQGKPAYYPSSISLVQGMQNALDGKANFSEVYTKLQANQQFYWSGNKPDTNSVVGLRVMFGRQNDAINLLQSAVNTGFLGLTNAINERVRKVDADGYYKPNSYTPPIGSRTVAGLVKAGTNVDIALDGTLTVTAPGSTTLADVNPNPGTVGSETAVPVVTFDTKGRATNVQSKPITPGGIGANAVMSMAQARLIIPANPPQAIQITDEGRVGTFYLKPGSTAADDGALTLKSGSLVYQRPYTEIDPRWFGAVGDSLTDDTQALRLALKAAKGSVLRIDAVYRVATNQLEWLTNTKIAFSPGGRLVTSSTTGNILSASGQRNLTIENGAFRAPNGNVKAVYVSFCQQLTFNTIRGDEVGFLRLEHSDYVKIVKPTFIQTGPKTGLACIDLNFFRQVDIDKPYIDGYGFSIQYWGGEGAPLVNGAKVSLDRNTPKGAFDLFVHNATLKNSIAGLWGVLGDNINLDGETLVENMDDVGLDAELSNNVTFRGFVVRGAKRGGLAVFYNSDNVRFIDGRVYAAAGDTVLAFHNGNTNIDAGRVSFEKVRFFSSAGQETGYLDGSAKELLFRDCYFENVYLNLARVAGRGQLLENNTFVNTLSGSPTMLQVGNLLPEGVDQPSLTLRGNVFRNRYALANGQKLGRAIQIFHQNEFIEDVLDRNETYGFDLDGLSQPQSAGIATAKKARIKATNNIFGNANLFANPTGTAVNFLLDNNNNRDAFSNFIGSNASVESLNKAVQGTSAQSRSIRVTTSDADKPSGFYNYNSSVSGLASGLNNFLGIEWRHEDGSGTGGFWMKRLFSDLNTDAFFEQTKFGDGRGFNTPMRLHSDRTFPLDHAMSPTTGQALIRSASGLWTSGTVGDMVKLTYDANSNGKVDDAEKLGGKLPTEFAPVSHTHTPQSLSLSGNTLSISGGNSVTLPASSTSGGGSSYAATGDEINGFLLGTDRLIDVRETGGMSRNQGYFHQVIATRSVQVGGVAFKITRGGSVSGSTYQNAVGLFDVSGNLLAIGDAASVLGSSGWKKVMFTASVNLVVGTKYLIGIVANGDDIPNFAAAQSYSDYNQFAPTTLLRNFRKTNVTTLNTSMNFAVDVSANTDSRIYLSLIAP